MASNLLVPFNFRPVSASQKNASYTIPTGKYALVKTLSPFFSIAGVNQFPSATLSVAAQFAFSGQVSVSKVISLNSPVYVFSGSSTGVSSAFAGGSWGGGTEQTYTYPISSRVNSGTLSAGNNPSAHLWVNAYVESNGTVTTTVSFYFFTSVSITEYWLPSGTVLDGNNYFVTEYNEIT